MAGAPGGRLGQAAWCRGGALECRALGLQGREAVCQALGSQLAFHGELKGTIYRPPRLGFLLRIQSQMWNDWPKL